MSEHEFHPLNSPNNDAESLQPYHPAYCCTPSKILPIFAVIFKAMSSAFTTRFVWFKVSRELDSSVANLRGYRYQWHKLAV